MVHSIDYIGQERLWFMACFCGCTTYIKDPDGFKVGCVKCKHGAQNHDDEFRSASRKNESQSQKRDVDFG